MEIEAKEKLGIVFDFDAEKLDNEMRKNMKLEEGRGITKLGAFWFLKDWGVYDELSERRIFLPTYKREFFHRLPDLIKKYSFNCSIYSSTKKFTGDQAVVTKVNLEKSHSVVLVDYDREKGFGILCSTYAKVYYMKPEELKKVFKTAYSFRLLTENNMAKMERLKQGDTRWNNVKIGRTNMTLGRWGRCITSICMVISELDLAYPTPDIAARRWVFDTGEHEGKIMWGKCDFGDVKWVGRFKNFDPLTIEKYANDKNKGVIVEVDNYHWLAVNRWEHGKPVLYDPLLGDELSDYTKRYKRITGHSLFELKS